MLDMEDRYEEALPLIRKATELDPKSPIIATELAGVYQGLGKMEEAFAVIRKSHRENPNFPNHYGIMTTLLSELGRLGEAAQWVNAGANLDSTNSFAAVSTCLLYIQLGDDEKAETCFDSAEEAYPVQSFGWRVELHQYRQEFPESLALMKEIAQHFPGPGIFVGLGYNHLLNGEWKQALDIVTEHWPELLGREAIQIGPGNNDQTTMAAWALLQSGDSERANYLFDQLLAWMQTTHRTRGPGYESADVFIHVIRGDKQKAIAALRSAINDGWRQNWFRLRYPLFDVMLDEPEWGELMTELEADIARQRQWFEDHKDDPLF